MIVGSILLAFAIDALWEERQDQIAELNTLEALHDEFESNIRLFNSGDSLHLQLATDTQSLLNQMLEAPVNSVIEVDDSQWIPLVAFLTTEAATGTLNTLLSSGQIDLFKNQELQQALAYWPATLKNSYENDVGVREFGLKQLIPGMVGHVDLSEILAAKTPAGLLSGNAFALKGNAYELHINPTTLSLVGELHLLRQMLLRGSRVRMERAERILGLIEAQIQL